ncbi:MAG: hypothetical protein C0485_18145 [Pirellula sp.]|nr:hypothetical protein [Pirellula sp.]
MRTTLNRLLLAIIAVAVTMPAAMAITVTKVKKINLLQNDTESPFFSQRHPTHVTPESSTFNPANLGDAVFTPVGTVQPGTVTSLTTNGAFSIVGDSTFAGGWTDGNGIPAGLTLTFNASLTFSVGANSPVNSTLTNAPQIGGGIGITQTGGVSTVDSITLNEVPNGDPTDAWESLTVSAVTVSDVSFSGQLAEAGFTFTGGAVGNFGPYVIRGNSYTETTEFMGLHLESADPYPALPAVGFGGAAGSTQGDGTKGDGSVAGHMAIDNTFADQAADSDPATLPNWFPRQIGGYTLTPDVATLGVKGIGYEYDVSYDITAGPVGDNADFNGDGAVDGQDFLAWQQNFGIAAGGTREQGNANPGVDGAVDASDLSIWKAQYGASPSSVAVSAIPEPAAMLLAALGVTTVLSIRRRGCR